MLQIIVHLKNIYSFLIGQRLYWTLRTGFSNLVFCKSKTLVIEIVWDSTSTMEINNVYSRVAAALDLNYILLISKEYYDGSISLNTINVTSVLKKKTIIDANSYLNKLACHFINFLVTLYLSLLTINI